MRIAAGLPAIVAITLAACGQGGVEAKDESAESVARKVAASDVKPRPGRWETAMKIEKFDMPGMPAQVKTAMERSMNSGKTFATCLTAEQVDRPHSEFFGKQASGCTYDHFSMVGGKIDAEMTCAQNAGKMHMTMKGDYGPDTYSVRATSQVSAGQGQAMTTTMAMTSRRTGDCTGKEAG